MRPKTAKDRNCIFAGMQILSKINSFRKCQDLQTMNARSEREKAGWLSFAR